MRMTPKIWLKVAVGLLLIPACVGADGQEAFGEVSFVNSGPAQAQSEFLRGLSQLHNFEYYDAAAHFRAAEQLAPGFAMAYWGEAMTMNHTVWHVQDRDAALEVLARLGATPQIRREKAPTEREKMYLQAVEILFGDGTKTERDRNYESAMAELHRKFPGDVDGSAFYALSILGSAEEGRDFAIYMRAAAVLEEVFPQHPRHPGVVHYLIHCYDDPIHAPLGLRPARIYSKIAPEAAHAQHMTSHIFLALGMWDEVVKANETAVAVTNQQRKAMGKPPRRCGHYAYWLEYGYLQQGRIGDARRVLEGCRAEAENEASQPDAAKRASADADSSSIGSYSEMRANFLIDTQLWNDPVAGWPLPAGDYPFARFTFDYVNALAALERGETASASQYIAGVETSRQRCEVWLDQRRLPDPQERQRELILAGQLGAMLSLQSGKSEEGIRDLRRLAAQEQGMPLEFGPPFVNKLTNELLGESLMRMKRPSDSIAPFRAALAMAPGRRLSTQQLAAATTESGKN